MEAEYEGTVTGLPFSRKAQDAVLSISGSLDDQGKIQFHISIEQGTTCNETKGEIGMAVPKPSGKATGQLSAEHNVRTLGVPIGFNPNLPNRVRAWQAPRRSSSRETRPSAVER